MKCLESDITLDPKWQDEQVDRLLGFEILQRMLHAEYQPIEAAILADKVAIDKGAAYRIIRSIEHNLNGNR
jgi:hypothetical protein